MSRGNRNKSNNATVQSSKKSDQNSNSSANPSPDAANASGEIHTPAAYPDKCNSEKQDKHWLDYAVALFAFLAFLAAGAAAAFTGWEAYIANDTAKRQLRAYLGVDSLKLNAPHLGDFGYVYKTDPDGVTIFEDFFQIAVKNYGLTPARDLSVTLNTHRVNFGFVLPDDFNFADPYRSMIELMKSKSPVQPGQIFDPGIDISPGNMDLLNAANAHRIQLFIYGHFEYFDIYDRKWQGHFCFDYEPWKIGVAQFVACDRHNGEQQIN